MRAERRFDSTTRSMPPPLCGPSVCFIRTTLIQFLLDRNHSNRLAADCPNSNSECPPPYTPGLGKRQRHESDEGGGDETEGEGVTFELIHGLAPSTGCSLSPFIQHEPCQPPK